MAHVRFVDSFEASRALLAKTREFLKSPNQQLYVELKKEWITAHSIYRHGGEAEPSRQAFVEMNEDSLTGEPLFGSGAANPSEASIVKLNPLTGWVKRVASNDRNVVLDASLPNAEDAVDVDEGSTGEWESSGIIYVSGLFGKRAGTLFLSNVQAHGIEDQTDFNPESRINRFGFG